jgi:pilus assembly protein Flp/PilA
LIQRFRRAEGGATAIEYALIAALIFLVIVISVTSVGPEMSNTFNNVANGFPEA